MTYITVAAHRSMTLDDVRNDAYAAALGECVTPDSVVLDLGAGTGVHGLIAARLGAKRVYLVEPEDILSVAEEIVAANGLQNVVRCIHRRIEDVELPEQVDIIVSALTGNFLLAEDLLPIVFGARDRFLKPGGVLVPGEATMELVPVSAPELHAREIANWSRPRYGVCFDPARAYAANTVFYRWDNVAPPVFMADPRSIHTIDFTGASSAALQSETTFEITVPGECHGYVGWFTAEFGSRRLSTSPLAPATHWSPAYLPLDPPVTLEAGERVSVTVNRPPSGDWTWTLDSARTQQRHSTLFSAPMKVATLKKAAVNYVPTLNADGRELLTVLSESQGSETTASIARLLRQRHPTHYRSDADALRAVQAIVKRYA
jgi:SAM-dependent methyltransferase